MADGDSGVCDFSMYSALEPVHTSTIARFGPARYDKIHNVNAPSFEPNQTLPNRTSPVDTAEPARYGTVIIETAHQSLF